MVTLATNVMTLTDHAKRLDPDGKIALIVELLNQKNGVLDDMLWKEANGITGHRTTVRTGLPQVFWRLLNAGVQPSKSTTAQIDEGMGMLEAFSEVDKDLAELNGEVGAFRMSEAVPFVEAMSQEMASTLFFGNSSLDPEEFNGLSIRYSDLSSDIGDNIIDGGGSGSDNMSVWLLSWGDQTLHGIFPKGSQAGLQHTDFGLQVVQTGTGIGTGRLLAYQEHWQWKAGIVLRDWRYNVRIANIDVSELVAGTGADLTRLMIEAIHRLPDMNTGTMVFYMNRTALQFLDIQRLAAVTAGGGLTYSNVDGKNVPAFRNIPIRTVDALVETEGTVS